MDIGKTCLSRYFALPYRSFQFSPVLIANIPMIWMKYWPSILETGADYHVLHTFLSYNLSFHSQSVVTSLVTPTNDGSVLIYSFCRAEQFQNYACRRGCSEITPCSQHYCVRLSIPVL